MGFFSGVQKLLGDDFGDRAARALAISKGDYSAAAKISADLGKTKAARAAREGLTASLRKQGMSDDEISIVLANPEKFSENYSSRFATRNVDEGSSVYTPGLNGGAQVFTAPKYFQHDADVGAAPPQMRQMPGTFGHAGRSVQGQAQVGPPAQYTAPAMRTPQLRTRGEQFGDSIAERGTPAWNEAVENHGLRAYGPNAQEMLGQRLTTQRDLGYYRGAVSERNNIRTTGTSAANNRRSTATSRDNNVRNNETTRGSYSYQNGGGRREAVAVGPDGRRIVVRNGKWVDAQTGQPVQ